MSRSVPPAASGVPSMMHTLPPTCLAGADALTDRADADLLAHLAGWIDASRDLLDRPEHERLVRVFTELDGCRRRLPADTLHPAARLALHRRLVAFLHDLTETVCGEAPRAAAAAAEPARLR